MNTLYKLVEVDGDKKKPLTDQDGLNILTNDLYGSTAQVALQIAQATRPPGKTAIWDEIK